MPYYVLVLKDLFHQLLRGLLADCLQLSFSLGMSLSGKEWSHERACAFLGRPLFKDWGHVAGHCALTQNNSKGPSWRQRSPRVQLRLTAQLVPLPHPTFLPFPMYQCQVTQLCPSLCDPMDCSPPGSSVHRILQARILEWIFPHGR